MFSFQFCPFEPCMFPCVNEGLAAPAPEPTFAATEDRFGGVEIDVPSTASI